MKLFARPKSFSEAIEKVTILNRLLGLRGFECPRDHPRPILSLIYFVVIYIIYCNGSLHVEEEYYASIRLMKLEYVLYKLLTYTFNLSVILKMLLGWWYTKQFKICHKKIFKIDETLRQLGVTVNYDRIYFVTIGTLTLWIIVAFILCTIVYIHLHTRTEINISIYIIVVYTYSVIVNSINVFEFYIFARCLQLKFRMINQLLRESLTIKETKLGIFEIKDYTKIMDADQRKYILSKKMIFRWRQRLQINRINVTMSNKQDPVISHIPCQFEKQFQNILRNRSQRHNPVMTKCQRRKYLLHIIKQIHLELCKVSKIVCTILGVQVALEIGVIIMFITGTLYNLYIRYLMNQQKVQGLPAQTCVIISLCFLNIVKAISLNYVSKNATNEGNRTIEIIYTIYDCDTVSDMQEEIQQFGIQILQSPVTFTAFGITLNNSVLSMILKTVTIYMVIMIQVSNSLESNNAIKYSHF